MVAQGTDVGMRSLSWGVFTQLVVSRRSLVDPPSRIADVSRCNYKLKFN